MNIDELTLGQLKEIISLLKSEKLDNDFKSPFIGQYVIVRTYGAGVHAGYLHEQNKEQVILRDTRRLWSWGSDKGVALSGVAVDGLSSGKKVDYLLPFIHLINAVEIIPCHEKARRSIHEYK